MKIQQSIMVMMSLLLAIPLAQASENDINAQLNGYQEQLNDGVEAMIQAGSESQKGTGELLHKIQGYWGDFHEYRGTPVEDDGKYRNTDLSNPTIYK